MAPADDAAAVRSMGEGDHAVVALGYPVQVQFVGNGEQAAVHYPPPPAHPAPQDSPLEDDSCSPCKKFLLGFVTVIVFLLLTELILSIVLLSAPSPLTVLIFLPVVAFVFTAGVVGYMALTIWYEFS